MRRLLHFGLLLTFFSINIHEAYPLDIIVKSIHENGTPSYFIPYMDFSTQSDAENMQQKLASDIQHPMDIAQKNEHQYRLTVGPIDKLEDAKSVQIALEQQKNQLPSAIPTSDLLFQKPKNNVPALNAPALKVKNRVEEDDTLVPSENTGRLWNLRNADIRSVINAVSRATGKNFIIDPRVQGKISIVSTTPIKNRSLYEVFLSVLQVSGYSAINSGNVIKIVPNIDAKIQSPTLLSQLKHPPVGDELFVDVIPVHYVPADQLVPVLRPLMPQWSNIAAYSPANMLILSGRANNIRSIARIIEQVDVSDVNGIDIVPLQHVLAMDVANTLKEILKTQPGMSTRTQSLVAPDDRSNSLLISGNKTDRLRLRLLITRLDKGSKSSEHGNTKVIYLNYLRAEDLVPILAGIAQANFSGNVGTTIGTITRPALDSTNPQSNLATGTNGNFQSSSSGTPNSTSPSGGSGAGAAGGAAGEGLNTTSATTQNEGTTKPTVQIIAEPNTNSIILSAPPSLIRTLTTVIHQLDVKPAQLLIEALVAEVDERDANNLGIEWGSNQQTGNPQNFRNGFAIINSHTGISDLQAEIFALARENKANILSTPSVVVLDNRQAKILVGQQVSIATTSFPNNAAGTTTASPFTTFDRVNVALHLYVRPQITRDKGIQLQIDQGNDTIDPTSVLNSTNPTFKISSIVTSVHVESGDIVILGGLTQNSLGTDDNRLPIVGDIPGIGRFFQHNIHSREKRVLMVFIKPIILGNPAQARPFTEERYDNIRQYQLDWLRSQSYDPKNEEAVFPPLRERKLPIPFGYLNTVTEIKVRHAKKVKVRQETKLQVPYDTK